ncbi:hypothetical protein G6F32_017271 [Rhizopus arrhizus]|nr:hypothetical protein G6F32_017271 [Rhizopus arrhizus]
MPARAVAAGIRAYSRQAPTRLAAKMWPRSCSSPSDRSMAACAMPRSASPSATCGWGHSSASRVAASKDASAGDWPASRR